MKKFVVLSLFGLLIMAFSATVYAQKLDFKASGFIETRSEWWRFNTNNNLVTSTGIYDVLPTDMKPSATGASAFDKTGANMETRARLKFDAVMDKNLSGTIFFEFDSAVWGDVAGDRNKLGYWQADRAALEVKCIYVDVGLPYFGIAVPMKMRVGIQPLAIRPPMLVYSDGAGITGAITADSVIIQPMWFKAVEGKLASSDDVDVYGLQVSAKVDVGTLGGYGLYYNMNTYPLSGQTTTYGASPTYAADMLWLGAYFDGKVGPVNLNFDFVYDVGKVEHKLNPAIADVDYKGWATRLKVDYPWEKFNFGVVGLYGSGADTKKTSAAGLPGELTSTGVASTKVKGYVVPPGSETGSLAESEVLFPSYITGGYTGPAYSASGSSLTRGTAGGLWIAKIYGSYKLTPAYKVTLQGLYIGDTTKNGNTFGNARISPYGTTNPRDDKTIGWEFDLINEWKVYNNLIFKFGGGFLIPGNALELWNPAKADNDKPATPWILTTALTYNF